jgi:hypothetical protein
LGIESMIATTRVICSRPPDVFQVLEDATCGIIESILRAAQLAQLPDLVAKSPE